MKTEIVPVYNLFQKGDIFYKIKQKPAFGSRCFSTREAAVLAAAIYDVLASVNENVSHTDWDMVVRSTLRVCDSPSKW